MARPRRLYVNPQGRYYYIINGKKSFLKVPDNLTPKQIQAVNIQNIVQGPARRIRKKKKQAVPIYGSKILRSGDMIQTTTGGLPGFVFKPQRKILSISEIATKSDDNTTSKILDLLKEAIPTFFKKDEKLPIPPVEEIPPPPPPPIPTDEEEALSEEEKLLKKMKDEELKRQEKEEKRLRKEEKRRQRELEKEALREERERLKEENEKLKKEQMFKKLEGDIERENIKQMEKEDKPIPAKEEPKPVPKPKILPPVTNLTAGHVKTFLRERYDDEYPGGFDNNKIANMRQLATSLGITDIQKKNINEIRKLVIAELNNRRRAGLDKPYKGKGGDDNDDDDGLYNDEIETIMKKRIKNYVPVVASDKVHELLQHVDKNDDFFTAVVNTDPTGTSGRHWTCIVMDNRDDYPSAEFFDSLAENSTPPKALLDVMRKIAQKMNPEKYFKFKFNKLMRQNNKNMNCGFHVMKFIEDRYNGVPFEEASGWTDYVRRQKGSGAPDDSKYGEGELKPYEKKIKNLFKSYL